MRRGRHGHNPPGCDARLTGTVVTVGSVPGPAPVGWRPRVAVAAVIVALVLPAVRYRDSFPLSTYPMYAGSRSDVATLPAVLGTDRRGRVERLSTETIARSDDPLITTSLLRQTIRSGRAEALCADIAGRAPAGTVTVEIVEERLDLVASAAGDEEVLDRTVHARCPVAS